MDNDINHLWVYEQCYKPYEWSMYDIIINGQRYKPYESAMYGQSYNLNEWSMFGQCYKPY